MIPDRFRMSSWNCDLYGVGTLTTKTMKQSILTVPQRKVLADMLNTNTWEDCLWKSAKQKYEDSRNSMRLALVREASGEAKELLDDLAAVREKIKSIEGEEARLELTLSKLGFSVDSDGEVQIHASSPLRKSIEKRLDSELGTINEVVNLPFERARVKVWTATTPEEAERILEPFLQFDVKAK